MSLFKWLLGMQQSAPKREIEVGDHIMFAMFVTAHGLAGILWSQPVTGKVIAFSDSRASVLIATKTGESWFQMGRIKVLDWLPPSHVGA